jgi:hypothetical protein
VGTSCWLLADMASAPTVNAAASVRNRTFCRVSDGCGMFSAGRIAGSGGRDAPRAPATLAGAPGGARRRTMRRDLEAQPLATMKTS